MQDTNVNISNTTSDTISARSNDVQLEGNEDISRPQHDTTATFPAKQPRRRHEDIEIPQLDVVRSSTILDEDSVGDDATMDEDSVGDDAITTDYSELHLLALLWP